MKDAITRYCSLDLENEVAVDHMCRNNSSAGMAAVAVAIAHKHTFRFKEKNILTSRAGFAYHAFIIVFFHF